MRFVRLFLMLLLAFSAACGRGGGRAADTTAPPTTPTTAPASTSTTSPYEVPEVIDVAYVERVMEALDHLDGEAGRRAVANRRFDEGFLELLMAVYTPKTFNLVQEGWFKAAEQDFEPLRPVPGDPVTTVLRLISASSDCVLFEADRDFSGVFKRPDVPGPAWYVALVPIAAPPNSRRHNPTPWAINFDGNYVSGNEPTREEACSSA